MVAASQPPPPRCLEDLAAMGVEVGSQQEYEAQLEFDQGRRRALLGLVTTHGWSWDDLFVRSQSDFGQF